MIKVGLTGGIGSGKTTVANIFKQLGVPIYFSDDRAKYLMLNNQFLRESLISLFGDKVVLNGLLNRSYIASKVFSNPKELIKLNGLVHPFVQKDFDDWSASQCSVYVIKEVAILFETGTNKLLDKVVLVESPKDLKVSRVMLREGMTNEEVLMRMSKQWPDDQKRTYADYIIYNDEENPLINQILKLHSIFSDSR
ncbi:MAG: dephospho-CoA kinase [Flavobacteriales bacterium]|nr:dephospho-CoA kinase [Flavobacteriales bacterium]